MMIVLVIAFTVFLINFTSSIGFNSFITYDYENSFFFSGGISIVFIDFTTLVVILMLILAFVVVIIVTITLVITKKRDIAIMKALGSIPKRLYGFYLTEVYVVFLIGFIIGACLPFFLRESGKKDPSKRTRNRGNRHGEICFLERGGPRDRHGQGEKRRHAPGRGGRTDNRSLSPIRPGREKG